MQELTSWSKGTVWCVVLATAISVKAQVNVPPIQWQRVYGGTEPEYVFGMMETADGGFVLGNSSSSHESGNKVSPCFGYQDYWVVRLDSHGDLVWEKTHGGANYEFLNGLVQLGNGSILAGGESQSPISGNKTTARPYQHVWLVCLDEQGEKLWEKSIGGVGNDSLTFMSETRDGGAIMAVSSRSETGDDKSAVHYGKADFWIVRLDSQGEMIWDRAYGGSGQDSPFSIRQTSDGGFIAAGSTDSGADGSKTSTTFGDNDYWVLRLDAQGNKLWECDLGGTEMDSAADVQETLDGGFLVAGITYSGISGNKTSPHYGARDIWIAKLSAQGDLLWDRAAGGTGMDWFFRSCKTWDGGFLLGGFSSAESLGGTITSTNHGVYDSWIMRLDQHGQELWQEHFGGSGFEQGSIITQTKDGGYAIAIMSASYADGNKTAPRFDGPGQDAWVIKTGPDVVMLRAPRQTSTEIREQGFRMQLSGPANAYVVEYSTNMAQWEPLREVVLTNNAIVITDPAATNSPGRVYRARGNPPGTP